MLRAWVAVPKQSADKSCGLYTVGEMGVMSMVGMGSLSMLGPDYGM